MSWLERKVREPAAIERLRRMASAWSNDPVAIDSESIIATAAARFASRASRRKEATWLGSLPFAFVGAIAAAALLLVTHRLPSASQAPASAVAIDSRASHSPSLPNVRESARNNPPSRAALAVPHVDGPRGVTPLADGLRIELKAGESAKVALADGQSSELRGPCAIEFWSSSTEVGGWRLSQVEPATSGLLLDDPRKTGQAPANHVMAPDAPATSKHAPGRSSTPTTTDPAPAEPPPAAAPADVAASESAASTASPKLQAAWVRAAEAQRRDDFAAADTAYGELCRAPDKAARDAARLARAQLWIAHGRGAEVRPVLIELAASGATPLVRQTARECLSR